MAKLSATIRINFIDDRDEQFDMDVDTIIKQQRKCMLDDQEVLLDWVWDITGSDYAVELVDVDVSLR